MWAPETEVEIAGIVGDVHAAALDGDCAPDDLLRRPRKYPPGSAALVVRGEFRTHSPSPPRVRGAVRRDRPRICPVGTVATMEKHRTGLRRGSALSHDAAQRLLRGVAIGPLPRSDCTRLLSYTVGQRNAGRWVSAWRWVPHREAWVTLVLRQGNDPGRAIGIGAGLVLGFLDRDRAPDPCCSRSNRTIPSPLSAYPRSSRSFALIACYVPAKRAAGGGSDGGG